MKRWLTLLTVLLLLLGGCGEDTPTEITTPTTAATAAPTEHDPGLYDPNHTITRQTDGAIAAYPLDKADYALEHMGDKLLLKDFDRDTRQMRLILLSGENCVKEAETLLSGVEFLNHIWAAENRVAYLDSAVNAIVMLDARLREVERISLPQETITSLQMDASLTVAYYTAEDRICAFDLQTGISRLLRRVEGTIPQLMGSDSDGMLRCICRTETDSFYELISCQDGRSYYSGTEEEQLYMTEAPWLQFLTDGPVQQWVYHDGTQLREFRPVAQEKLLYLADLGDGTRVAIHEKESGVLLLELYDLCAGRRVASVTLKGVDFASYFIRDGEAVWFVADSEGEDNDVLCRWKPEMSPAEPGECFFPYYSKEDPDVQGLAECAAMAEKLGDTYGITISLAAPEALLDSYTFREEYQVSAIRAALEEIEEALAQFPEDFYKRIFRITENKSFHISLVRSVTAANGMSVPDGNGLQAWVKGNSYLVLPVGEDTLSQFYHQLWHMAETYVMDRNSFLDNWGKNNPEGFAYLERYPMDPEQVVDSYLSGPLKAFLNSHSMTYPREDRATFFEYAIQPGNETLFESETMQLKLNTLCWSIRRAFRWEESEEVFPWEQYLDKPPYGNKI